MSTRRFASSMAGRWLRPSIVECATLPSCSLTAASILGCRWPWTLHQSDETPSMYVRPSVSVSVVPSADSMISGSSSTHACCWVNGCQMCRWSSAARDMPRKLGREPVGNREHCPGFGQAVGVGVRHADHRHLAEALDGLHV